MALNTPLWQGGSSFPSPCTISLKQFIIVIHGQVAGEGIAPAVPKNCTALVQVPVTQQGQQGAERL